MEQSTLKCIYEFTDCTRELDCTDCEIKNNYYKELHHKTDDIKPEANQPVLLTT